MTAAIDPSALRAEVSVRWSDQDRNGHVNNAAVVTLIEEARISAMKQLTGSTPDGKHPRVVRSLLVDYEHPVHHGEKLDAKVWITRMGQSSYTVRHELIQTGVRCVSADAVIVQLNPSATSAEPLSPQTRALLERVLLPHAIESDDFEKNYP